MMFSKPAFLICPNREADVFDTRQQADQAAATTDELSSALVDWKGERSRRVLGEVSTGRSEATEERSEPRAHESARASGTSVPSGSTSETAQSPTFQLTSYQ